MEQLICQNVSLGYDSKEILRNLNFTVGSGDYLCIIGENGSGKTTLMKTLLGLHTPTGGEIILGDELKPNEIGYLPQQTAVQKDFPASVLEIVLSGFQSRCSLRPFYNKEEKQLWSSTAIPRITSPRWSRRPSPPPMWCRASASRPTSSCRGGFSPMATPSATAWG